MANVDKIEAETEHKTIEADLNLVKLAMELEDVQFNQIRRAFELAQSIKIANEAEKMSLQNAQNQIQNNQQNVLTPIGG